MSVHAPRILERWQTILADWRSSGLSVAAFCRSRQVNPAGLYHWRKILDELAGASPTPHQAPVPTTPATAFVPVRVIPDAVIEVVLPSGIQLRVPLSADAQQLARLVLALGATSC